MSKIKDSIIDVPMDDTDYDYELFKLEQEEMDAIDIEDMMTGVSYDEPESLVDIDLELLSH